MKPGGDRVLRVERTRNFKSIDLTSTDDARLSWKAVGVHLYLMSRPDGWSFYEADLIQRHKDGGDSVRSGLRELEECGYLDRKQLIQEKGTGRILGRQWTVREHPEATAESIPPKTHGTGFPSDGKPGTSNIEVVAERIVTPTPLPPAGAGASVAGDLAKAGDAGSEDETTTPARTKNQREAAEVEEVLDDWRAATGRKRQYRSDSRGWRKVRDRLRAGYSRKHLRLAVAGARADSFMTGTDRNRNPDGVDYTFPETIFRDDDAVERHIRTARSKLTPQDWWPAPDEDFAAPAAPQSPAPSTASSNAPLYEIPDAATQRAEHWERLWNKLAWADCNPENRFNAISAAIRLKRLLGVIGETVKAPDGTVYEPTAQELQEMEWWGDRRDVA